MKLYVSGPISGRSKLESYTEFRRITDKLREMGHDVVNPREISDWGLSWETYMEIASRILESGEIDGMILLPGWERSKGSCIEKTWADAHGIHVMEVGKS